MVEIFNDHPPSRDLLGYGPLIDVIADVVRRVQPPFSIGIFSKWGFGKTTFMTLVQQKLKPEAKIKTIWFNPWKYNEKELVWKALIAELYTAIVQEDTVSFDFLKQALEKVANFTGALADREDLGTKFFDIFRLEPKFLNEMENFTNRLIDEYVGREGKIVIFIDDLDRCLPENAIKVLEAIMLFFDNSRCIFIIGLDKSVIEKGIHAIYDEKIGMSGIDYLEKIIQLPVNIPAVSDENMERFILSLCDAATKDAVWEVLKSGSDANPRRIKRFFNIFRILKEISGLKTPEEQKLLAKVIMLQLRFPTFYAALVETPAYLNSLHSVARMKPADRQPYLTNDPALDGFYADRDLRRFVTHTSAIACTDSELVKYLQLTHAVHMTGGAKED